MAPINGRPFLEVLLEYWTGQGVDRFVLSVGYLAQRIRDHFGVRWHGADVLYAEEPEALGTGGALVLAASHARSADIVVMNGDSFFAVDLDEFRTFHTVRRADWSLSLFRSSDVTRYLSLAIEDDGRVQSLSSKPGEAQTLVNGGVYLVRRAALETLPWRAGERFSLEAELLPHALQASWRMFGREFAGQFIDIGVPDDYRRAGTLLGGLSQ
jgi:D-glycero-alpha-D-manno-heptose 1-phosphate guanylyltransferase